MQFDRAQPADAYEKKEVGPRILSIDIFSVLYAHHRSVGIEVCPDYGGSGRN